MKKYYEAPEAEIEKLSKRTDILTDSEYNGIGGGDNEFEGDDDF